MKYSKEVKTRLKENPNILEVYPTLIRYTEEFKQEAVRAYNLGKSPREIFENAGFNLDDLSSKREYANKTIVQWKSKLCSSNSNKKSIAVTNKEKEFLLAKIAYLEEENTLLKKLRGLID